MSTSLSRHSRLRTVIRLTAKIGRNGRHSWPCSVRRGAKLPGEAGQLDHVPPADDAAADIAATVPMPGSGVRGVAAEPVVQAHEPSPAARAPRPRPGAGIASPSTALFPSAAGVHCAALML